MATVTATCSPSSLQLRFAFNCGNCGKASSVLVRRRLGKLDRRARVLCVAQGNERSGAELEPRRNGGSWVGSNSNADGFKGWSDSDNGEESLDSQRRKWFGGTVGAGVAGVVLVAGLTFAALSLGKRNNSSPKQQMEPLTTQQERSLTYDDEIIEDDASSSPEGRTGTNENSSSSPEIDESPSEIRVDNDYDIGGLSAQDFKNTSGGTEANAINNASDKRDSPLESTSDDKSVEPETFTRKFDLSESDNGSDSFVASEIEGFDSSLTVGIGDLASELKGNLVSVEPTNLQASDSNLSTEPQDGIPGRSENHISTFESSSLSVVAHEHNEPVALDVSLTSQSNTILEPQVSSKDNIGTVPSSSTEENLEMSKTLQVLAEGISSSLETNTIIETLQVPPGKVLVPAVVDQVQGQAFAALQVLRVIEADVQPGDLCTRREYARWLVSASSALSRNSISKVYPSMYIENVTELAFDDITPEDPDFPSIQGLAEAGLISSKLSRKDMRSSMDEDDSPFYFSPESPLSRQDLVSWKMALEKRYLPKADKEVLYRISGFIDADKIHPDACPALVADLSGEQGIIALAFGYTRLFQPDKPVTKAQAAIALATGEYSDLVSEELARIEAESIAENAVDAHNALVAEVEKDVNANFEKDLSLEREKIDAVEKMAEEARRELLRLRSKREEDNIALMKEHAAVESEMEVLSKLRHEVEEQLQSVMSNKVEISYEKERISKLRIEAETESQEIARLQYDLEVERKALSMARAWAEDEAKRAREHAKVLEEARDRWERQGIKIVVDNNLREDALGEVTWLDAGKPFSVEGTANRAENLMDKLKALATNIKGKSRDIIDQIIQKIALLVSNLREWIPKAGKGAAELKDAAISKASRSAQELQQSTLEFSLAVKEGAKRVAEDCREGVGKLTQKFKA
ncbi:golgin subfamily A member 4 [Pyrus ussuriensis x Pyrus communis]|uniref:Golgin subfamily A member 4 n=1 Tax=Pyrus ussuriensis x Pyrus communis TaxID=2448454 RepID=A0A5N5F157_9ROSA|nr:golgin subfamily A member 4 [Pyrus ussuriensis x Pyrus communis]